jgi:nucleotide-binding universal stress UspA family protein
MERKIVVGFDGSEQAHDALALGRLLAQAIGARIVLADVYVHETVP